MAKNYTFAEAVKIINEGTDLEALVGIGRRYPVLMHKVTQVCALAGEEFVELMGFMPEYLTANKVNSTIKALITGEGAGDDSGSDEDDGEGTGEAGKDYESMSAKQLYEILKKAGKHKTAKSIKKADLLAAVKAMEAGGNDEAEDDGEDDGEESGNPYDGMNAVELYKECKKRGLKPEIKKPAKYYVDLLTKNDAESKDEDDGDDWDEDDGEAEKETKTGKGAKTEKAAGKKTGKGAKKEEDEDGDNWDI